MHMRVVARAWNGARLKETDLWGTIDGLRACLHGGGGPMVGDETRLGGVTHLTIQSLLLILSRLHDRWGDHMRSLMDSRAGVPHLNRLPHLPGVPRLLHVNRP